MRNLAVRLAFSESRSGVAFLALFAAVILLGSTVLDASARAEWVRFDATWQGDGTVLVVWETSSEFDSIAYFLYRAESSDGPWEDYIAFEPATGNEFTPATYSFKDEQVNRDVTYYYRLEEVAADNTTEFKGPVVPTTGSTGPATSAPATTSAPGQEPQVAPSTATRQYTGTPVPAGAGTVLPTETRPPTLAAPTVQAALTRSLTPLITTPTPLGGVPPTVEAPTPIPEVTGPPEDDLLQPSAGVTDTAVPALPSPQDAPIPSPTVQQLAAARKETSQPLLDSSTRLPPAPDNTPSQPAMPRPKLGLLLGGGILVAAAVLGAVVLLVWRRRVR